MRRCLAHGAEALTYQLLMLSGDSPGVGSLNSEQEGPLVRRLLSYLNLHLTEDLSLDGLAERFYISKHHLNKIFKRSTSTTVMDYVIHKRVAMARQLIREGLPGGGGSRTERVSRLLRLLPGLQARYRRYPIIL